MLPKNSKLPVKNFGRKKAVEKMTVVDEPSTIQGSRPGFHEDFQKEKFFKS